jgi:thioredoxin reductase (NADPH)
MDELERLEHVEDAWSAVTRTGAIKASAVILATGSSPRELGIPGESELVGRGVSHCASCDGPLHRERTVGVIGGGDSALQEALELAEHVGEVIIFHRGSSFTGQEAYQRRVLASPQIQLRFGTVIDEISGATAVEAVAARDVETGATERVELSAVFPCIGSVPRTSFLADTLRLDDEGRIPTDGSMRTSAPGLFAAGDVRSGSAAQAVAVAGDGATAAVAAHRYLLGLPWPSAQLERVGADG